MPTTISKNKHNKMQKITQYVQTAANLQMTKQFPARYVTGGSMPAVRDWKKKNSKEWPANTEHPGVSFFCKGCSVAATGIINSVTQRGHQ